MNEYIEITREQFKDEINWGKWDEIVALTRKQIAEALKDYKAPINKYKDGYEVYGYNNNGELVKHWNTKRDCCEDLNGNGTTVYNYLKQEWIYKGYLLSKEELTKDVAFAKYRFAMEHGKVFVDGTWKNAKKRKPIYCYNENGKLVGAYESGYKWANAYGYKSYNAKLIKNDRIVQSRLTSYNFYDEITASEIYKELNEKRSIPTK